jgi:hypothetical protein
MSEASRLMQEWRDKKYKAGLRPLTFWVTADVKDRLEQAARDAKTDVGTIVTAVVWNWMALPAWERTRIEEQMGSQIEGDS